VAEDKAKKPASGLPIALAVITLAAGCGGAGFAFLLPKPAPAQKSAVAKSDATAPAKGHGSAAVEEGHGKSEDGHKDQNGHGKEPAGKASPALPAAATKFKDIPAITTNLAGEKAPWIRLEGGLLYDPAIEADMAVLTARITEDFVTYLRSVKINEISGGGGLQALAADLNERARLRSNGKVHQFVINSFILE
jgi:flagellar protein FliL